MILTHYNCTFILVLITLKIATAQVSKVIFFLEIFRPDPCTHSLFLSASVILTYYISDQLLYRFAQKNF